MDKFGNDPRDRDPKPVERRLIPMRLCHKSGGAIVTDWQGRERHYKSITEAVQAAADLYPKKRTMLAEQGTNEPAARWSRPLAPIVWHAQRGATYSRGKASPVRYIKPAKG